MGGTDDASFERTNVGSGELFPPLLVQVFVNDVLVFSRELPPPTSHSEAARPIVIQRRTTLDSAREDVLRIDHQCVSRARHASFVQDRTGWWVISHGGYSGDSFIVVCVEGREPVRLRKNERRRLFPGMELYPNGSMAVRIEVHRAPRSHTVFDLQGGVFVLCGIELEWSPDNKGYRLLRHLFDVEPGTWVAWPDLWGAYVASEQEARKMWTLVAIHEKFAEQPLSHLPHAVAQAWCDASHRLLRDVDVFHAISLAPSLDAKRQLGLVRDFAKDTTGEALTTLRAAIGLIKQKYEETCGRRPIHQLTKTASNTVSLGQPWGDIKPRVAHFRLERS